MRNSFIKKLSQIAETDERVVLLTGDLGFSVLEEFREKHPKRFYNCGVSEQNMLGVATGLAKSGYLPFVYSIGTFASMRGYEFLRNGALLNKAPVKIISVGAGFDYGSAGVTHYPLEDLAIMRAQPNVEVICPYDCRHAASCVEKTALAPNSVFYRVSKTRYELKEASGKYDSKKLTTLHPSHALKNSDCLLVALGSISSECVKAAELLQKNGIKAGLVVVSSFNSEVAKEFISIIDSIPLVFSVEDHFSIGGLSSWSAEQMAASGSSSVLVSIGVDKMPDGVTGDRDFMNNRFGLSAAAIANKVLSSQPTRKRLANA